MKYRIVSETAVGTVNEDRAVMVLETNSSRRAGAFVRRIVWLFEEGENIVDITDRLISIETDGVKIDLPEENWTEGAKEWLRKNDWY